MEKLPEKSEASTSGGIWFVWNDGTNIIRVWGSFLSGKEKIYLNDTLISEKKNIKANSQQTFEDSNKNIYGVKVHAKSMFSNSLECQFTKNGVIMKKQVCKFLSGKLISGKNIVIFLAGFVVIFILHLALKISETTVFLLLLIVFGIVLFINGKKQYVIEDIVVEGS